MAIERAERKQQNTTGGEPLPPWLRVRFADALDTANADAIEEAKTRLEPFGIIADRRVRSILATADTGSAAPSAATVAAYRRDHARMLASGVTPLDKASTFQHYNRLRTAFRFGEVEAIAALRKEADRARREKRTVDMRRLTQEAFDRASIFHALFLADSRPMWSQKSAELRATGQRGISKSKRKAGRVALSPDQLLVAIGNQWGRAARVELMAACFAMFGIRPAELRLGVELQADGENLRLVVTGAKVDDLRGQPQRTLEVAPARRGLSGLTAQVLQAAVKEGRGRIAASEADLAAVRRAMREAQPGLSPYAYRHARASDAKGSLDRETVAQWLGHSTDRTQSNYGHGRSRSGAVRIRSANASRAVRTVKTLPASPALRLARAIASRRVGVASQPTSVNKQRQSPRRGPRLG